jgi:hypothetical protein
MMRKINRRRLASELENDRCAAENTLPAMLASLETACRLSRGIGYRAYVITMLWRFQEKIAINEATSTRHNMSIYISTNARTIETSDIEFRIRGIVGRRTSPSSAPIFASNPIVTPGLATIKEHLAYYASARSVEPNAEKPFVYVGQPLDPTMVQGLPDFPLPMPDVAFSTPKAIKDIEEFGAKKLYERGKEQVLYAIRKPTIGQLQKIAGIKDVKFNVNQAGFASINGARAFRTVRKLVKWLAEKHQYYQEPEDTVMGYLSVDSTFATVTHPEGLNVPLEFLPEVIREKRKREALKEDESEEAMELPGFLERKVNLACIRFDKGITTIPATITSQDDLPNLPGILFPYFRRMCNGDVVGVSNFLSRYCYPILGKNNTERATMFNNLVEDIATATSSEEGQMLGHMVKGFMMAMDASCKYQVIVTSGKYGGFLLSGYNFTVKSGPLLVSPSSPATVIEEFAKIDSHDRAVRRLQEILRDIDVSETDKDDEMAVITEWTCNRDIWRAFEKREEDHNAISDMSPEIKREVRALVADIKFEEEPEYLEASAENIIEAIDFIHAGRKVTERRPMFLGDGVIFDYSIQVEVLSQFGTTAPTPWMENQSVLRKFASLAVDEPLYNMIDVPVGVKDGVVQKERRQDMAFLYFTRVPIMAASADWRKIESTGGCRQPKETKTKKESKELKVFTGVELRKVWDALRKFYLVNAIEKVTEVVGRKVEGENVGIMASVKDFFEF